MQKREENIDFGVDYSMVLEFLLEKQSSSQHTQEESKNIYSKSENLQLQSVSQNSITKSPFLIRKIPLLFTSSR
jgi:hypothetical protein